MAADKSGLTRKLADEWKQGLIGDVGQATAPERPARSAAPLLMPPSAMPRRSKDGVKGRTALLHALAHIELNAIDLAWDIIARFTTWNLPRPFYDDWVQVALDEADHFDALEDLLGKLGASYGDLPAHDGLWQAAVKTSHDLMDRLALVPMTLEARGLDTTPASMRNLERHGHGDAVPVLQKILEDEIAHVAAGTRWFAYLCGLQGLDPAATYRSRLAPYFPQGPKPPFNHAARLKAGQTPDFYDWTARFT
ncbi:MAG: ferritin-like domain-containing protein [Alphaproteobacteria bacterium]|nr:ferritin-like domain-containing protein [Alphaproteobacteria bacterium]